MKRKFIQCLCLTLFGVLLFPGRAARAIEPRLSLGYYWHGTPRTVNVYCPMSSSDRSYVQSAMNTWNAVKATTGTSAIKFQFTSNVNAEAEITWSARSDSSYVGYTQIQRSGSYLTGFSMWINSTQPIGYGAVANKYDFQSTVLHELGHGLGIAHCHEGSASCPWSSQHSNFVMYPISREGITRRTLQSYDINSYKAIY